MPKFSVKVKWGKEMYPGVEVNTDDEPELFKAQIFALTGVQPERQKVVCKGVTLRDDGWGSFKLVNNALVLVMGSKEEDLPTAPVEQTKFLEDMNEAELASALDLPEGLINLGNTCYMNATVQCLKTVPELKNALISYNKAGGGGASGALTGALSDTMAALEGGGAGACAGAAAALLRALHSMVPRFAERGAGGVFAQQDASECWSEIVRALQQRLPAPAPAPGRSALNPFDSDVEDIPSTQPASKKSSSKPKAPAAKKSKPRSSKASTAAAADTSKSLFGSDTESEAEAPPKKKSKSSRVFPDSDDEGDRTQPIRAAPLRSFLSRRTGSGYTFQKDLTKQGAYYVELTVTNSKDAERDTIIEQYFGGAFDVELVCSEADEPPTRSKESFLQLSCFISQDVKYLQSGLRSKMTEQITKMSETLGRDAVYTKTSKISRLPAYLTVQFVRFYYKEKESINAKILKDVKFPLELDTYELCTPELQERLAPMRAKFKELEDAAAAAVETPATKMSKNQGDSKNEKNKKRNTLPYHFEDDVGSNNSGKYRLQAVLTHRGRSSSSGHYVAWVARGGGAWLRCDDDAVSPVSEEDVLKLSGGGDWHCAYLLLYGPKVYEIPVTDQEDEPAPSEAAAALV